MRVLAFLFILQFFTTPVYAGSTITDSIKNIPVQNAGRVKPFDSLAREALTLIYGKSKFKGKPAHEIVLTWLYAPAIWADKQIVQIKKLELKKNLKLSETQEHFSVNELLRNDRLPLTFQELAGKRATKEKLDPYFQAVQRLQNQLGTFQNLAEGQAMRLVPPKTGTKWLELTDPAFPANVSEKFAIVTQAFVSAVGLSMKAENEGVTADLAEAEKNLEQAVAAFVTAARVENPELYATEKNIKREVHYNNFDPFKWSWIIYLIASLLLLVAWLSGHSLSYKTSWVLFIVGLIIHSYGFYLRVIIAGRPPVSNMYETVIWVSWGGLLFGMVIEAVYKQRFVLLCGGISAILCLIVASLAPAILDASIQPLEPVLVSNFWLITHVLTITISYSAFLLAFVLGDIGLGLGLVNEEKNRKRIMAMSQSAYRAIQIGVVLLAAGIILGGIWADYSWGRFWGWDPKETWALIALLGYLAILHGRLAGVLRAFGMLASSVVAFSLVIMAWYGVNFVLGAGLHSYGFGGGGVQYVSAFVGVHMLYVLYAAVARQKSLKTA